MISHLKGTVEQVLDNALIIDVNGIGYKVICSSRTINAAGNANGIVHIFTELISESERFWFDKLTSVQGVGGRVAMAILSVLSDDDIYNAFLSTDKDMFTRADGVGQKLASRIISELKEKVVGKTDIASFVPTVQTNVTASNVANDVISALVNLGYQKSDIYRIMSTMKIADDIAFDVLLRQVLSKISSGG